MSLPALWRVYQRDLSLAAPLDLPGLGAGDPLPGLFPWCAPVLSTPWPPTYGSSEPARSHPVSRCPWRRSKWPKRKKSLLRKSSVTSVIVGKEVRDPQKSGHCGQRVCSSVSKGLPGHPCSPSQMQCAGGRGTSRPRRAETDLLPSSPLTWLLPPETSWATPIKTSDTSSHSALVHIRECGDSGAIWSWLKHSGAASSLCGLGQVILPLGALIKQ